MAFWNRRNRKSPDAVHSDSGKVQKIKKTVKRSPPVALEAKLVAIEALESGLSPKDVAEIVGVADGTLAKWRRQQEEGALSPGITRPRVLAIETRLGSAPAPRSAGGRLPGGSRSARLDGANTSRPSA